MSRGFFLNFTYYIIEIMTLYMHFEFYKIHLYDILIFYYNNYDILFKI